MNLQLWFQAKVLAVAVKKMAGLRVGRVGAEEMRELERDGLFDPGVLRGFQLEAELLPFDRQELDRHIAVKGLAVGPAAQVIFVGQRPVYF